MDRVNIDFCLVCGKQIFQTFPDYDPKIYSHISGNCDDPLVGSGKIILSEYSKIFSELVNNSIDLIYIDPPFFTQQNRGDYMDRFLDFQEYLNFIENLALSSLELLKQTGNFVIHLDWRTVHYVKVLLDRVFPIFNNEIIWCYHSGGASTKRFAKKHDTLLWYSKSKAYTFNIEYEPYHTPNVLGRKGFNLKGRMLNDWWEIGILSTTSKKRLYSSQKPTKLLERLIKSLTNPHDLVLDPMAGSGTTGEACLRLARNFILIDNNQKAFDVMRERLVENIKST